MWYDDPQAEWYDVPEWDEPPMCPCGKHYCPEIHDWYVSKSL